MALPGRAKEARDHKLALALELARREQGLSTGELGAALSCSPRTVRRYLNGERRPQRETVVRWEEVCGVDAGSLTVLHDRSAGAPLDREEPPSPIPRQRGAQPARTLDSSKLRREAHAAPARRPVWHLAAAFIAVAAAVALVVLGVLGTGRTPDGTRISHGPSPVATHRFPPTHVGDVWARIAPTRQDVGQDHRVTLRWGPITRQIVLRRLGPAPQSLLFRKNKPDDIAIRVTVQPPSTITFGENKPPDSNPLDINSGWTKAG